MDGTQSAGAARANLATGASSAGARTIRRTRRAGLVLAVASALGCCALLAPAAASAAGTGSISGTVTVAGGGTAAGTKVCATEEGRGPCAEVNDLGDYTIEELEAGEYTVEFTGEKCEGGCTHPYVQQFYDGVSEYEEATPIALSAGQQRSGVDAVLEPGAVIEGTVESEHKAAVSETDVCALRGSYEECATTNGAGKYAIEGLGAGEYKVEFGGTVCASTCKRAYVEQFYDDAPDYSSAQPLTVQPGETKSAIDANLQLGNSIAGVVQGSKGASGAVVCARPRPETGFGERCVDADEAGDYEIEGLLEGEYTVSFTGEVCVDGSCTQPYVPQYYEDASEEAQAKGIVLSGHGVHETGIDATLEAAGSIAGVVEAGGAPLANTRVCFQSQKLESYGCRQTNAEGQYKLEGLRPSDDYIVEFSGEVCSEGAVYECDTPYVTQYWKNASEQSKAQPITVTGEQTTPKIDATLALGGQIDGAVTSAALGKPGVAGLEVCAFGQSREAERCSDTQSDGDYAIEGLASGTYTVEFEGEICSEHGCADEYLRQFYDGVSEESEAKPVAVSAPAAVTGIDATVSESKPKAPAVLAAPTLTGSAAVGATLQCSEGSFSNNPTRLAYEWLRDGAPIPGATANTYLVTTADEGQTLACEVTVLNAAGSASARSNALAIPAKASPAPAPEVAGHGSVVARGTATEKKGRVLLELICTGSGPCAGEAKLVVGVTQKRGKHHKAKLVKLTIGKLSFSLAAGAKQTLSVKLTKKGSALIVAAGKRGVKVQLSGSDLASRMVVVTATGKPTTRKKKKKG